MRAKPGDTITFFFEGEMYTTTVLADQVCLSVSADKIELVDRYLAVNETERKEMYDQMELEYLCEDVPECPGLRVFTGDGPRLIVNMLKVFRVNGQPIEV